MGKNRKTQFHQQILDDREKLQWSTPVYPWYFAINANAEKPYHLPQWLQRQNLWIEVDALDAASLSLCDGHPHGCLQSMAMYACISVSLYLCIHIHIHIHILVYYLYVNTNMNIMHVHMCTFMQTHSICT